MPKHRRLHRLLGCIVLPLALTSAAAGADAPAPTDTPAMATADLRDLKAIIPHLATKRVVFIGEQHNRYDHHLSELAIIQGIAARNTPLAIGMEMFQQPDQRSLDAYIAGTFDEQELLIRTQFDKRWSHGPSLYGAVLRFARAHGIPVLALSAPDALVDKVRAKGIAGLSAEERAQLPEIDYSDATYRGRLERIFAGHPGGQGNFGRFLDVQLLWDEAMAARAADYLRANPERRLVVIAGNGHISYGSGIPQRLKRRLKVDDVIVVQGEQPGLGPRIADFILFSEPLPPPQETF
jgi:uncharacterized iron-regulated protein